jgi:beta-lactamase regulating signal transducer with metallopeptidase domain
MDWLSPFSDAALKAAVVLATATVIDFVLRKRSAASRHLMWTLAIVAAIGMPILTAMLPTWHVLPAVPPAPSAPVLVVTEPAPVVIVDMPNPAPAIPALHAEVLQSNDARIEAAPARTGWNWLAIAWIIGTTVMLIPAAIGMLSLMRLGARSIAIQDNYWLNLCAELCRAIGLKREVVLLTSTRRAMPMTWGILRPKVLLPADADGWPAERQRLVLMHELAHVKRRDSLAQLLGQLARAIYWFNPFAWVAVFRMAHLRERACDNIVLNLGIKASDYATELLSVATGYRAMASGMAMARSNKLETRLRAILDGRVDRRGMTQRAVIYIALLLAGIAIPLATMGTRARADDAVPAPATQPDAPAPAATAAPAAPDELQAPATTTAASTLKEQNDYKIGKNDELSVSVFDLMGEGTGEHNRLVRVSESGNIALDFIRPLKVEGLTEQEAVNAIVKAYHDAGQIKTARVMVTVTQKHDEEFARLKAELDRTEALLAQMDAKAKANDADAAQVEQLMRDREATARRTLSLFTNTQTQPVLNDVAKQLEIARLGEAQNFPSQSLLNFQTPHRFVRVQDGLYYSVTARPGTADNWSAKLDNDVVVQLIGISEHPSKNRPWWKPDGSPLAEVPYDDFGRPLVLGSNPLGREFAVRLQNPKNMPVDFSWSFDPATSQTATGELTLGGKPVADIRSAATALPGNQTTETLLLGVASGSWRMSGEHAHIDQSEGMKNPWGTGDVLFAPANETVAGLEQIVSYNENSNSVEVRLIAVGADGKEQNSSWSSSSGQGTIGQVTARFSGLHAADVSKFVLETRPYQWVEFANVALWGKQ